MSDQDFSGGPKGKLPDVLLAALGARSEGDVTQQPDQQEIAAARRVDGLPPTPPDPLLQLQRVLGPDVKVVLGALLLAGWKLVELTAAEKQQVQAQMLAVVRESTPAETPNVLRMGPKPWKPRIIRPH